VSTTQIGILVTVEGNDFAIVADADCVTVSEYVNGITNWELGRPFGLSLADLCSSIADRNKTAISGCHYWSLHGLDRLVFLPVHLAEMYNQREHCPPICGTGSMVRRRYLLVHLPMTIEYHVAALELGCHRASLRVSFCLLISRLVASFPCRLIKPADCISTAASP
jgi:hypothetical protein